MNYQPFLGMNVLVSDDLIEAIQVIMQAFAMVILALLVFCAFFWWLRRVS